MSAARDAFLRLFPFYGPRPAPPIPGEDTVAVDRFQLWDMAGRAEDAGAGHLAQMLANLARSPK